MNKADTMGVVLEGKRESLQKSTADVSLLHKASDYNIDLENLEKVAQGKSVTEIKKTDKHKEDTEWKQLDVKLADIANLIFDNAGYPVFVIQDDNLVYINQTAKKAVNISPEKNITGTKFLNLVRKDDWEKLAENIGEMLTSHKALKCNFMTSATNSVELSIRAVYLSDIEHFSFILIGEEKKTAEKEGRDSNSFYDENTGLPSFFLFEDRLQMAVLNANMKASEDDAVAVVSVNIDNMADFTKLRLNDVVIKRIADNLVFNLPKNFTVSRGLKYHFWILLTGIKGEFDLDFNIRRIREVLDEGIRDNFVRHKVNYSVGASIFPQKARSAKELVEQTVVAMRQAVSDIKNNATVIYNK